ncbi:MAG: DUF378 domain-containing protein [Clostridia bacterium]|nr:DUF378 domain-containing protein [Clostridia bacterium]
MDFIDNLALTLVIIGAVNWGSVGIFGFDFVSALLGGSGSVLTRIVFSLVGIAGLWCIGLLFKDKEPKTAMQK